MAVQVSYPGVYIDEFAPGAPIQGVGTSVAAFIGPAARGDMKLPTKLTSLDQFFALFGERPLPGFYLWHAVRGFFENGGRVCYIVRASNGDYDRVVLSDTKGNDLAKLRARQPGQHNPPIQVTISAAQLLQNARLYAPSGTYTKFSGRDVTLSAVDAAKFRPGDYVVLENSTQAVQIVRVGPVSLRLADDVIPPPKAAPALIRLADIAPGVTTIRVDPQAQLPQGTLVAGTMLKISQNAVFESQIVDSVQVEGGNPTTYRVSLRQGLKNSFLLDGTASKVESQEFTAAISQGGQANTYDNLAIDPTHPRYFADMINNRDPLVVVGLVTPPPVSTPPDNLPQSGAISLSGGQPENLGTLADSDFTDALDTLLQVPDVNLVAVPGNGSNVVRQAVITHCEQMGDRFGILDPKAASPLFNDAKSIENQRHGLDSTRGYAALYYPWLMVPPAGAGAPILVPPSGHVCGIMARVDNTRGVHKAPANEIVSGALDVERTMSDQDQGILNLEGINVIRVFTSGGRPILWGARTTATDTNWQYVNIRRLFLFLEKSIQAGIRWAVFEPNNTSLWEKLRRTITDFLTRVWRDGGLFGETADKAFYVRIDETLNPDSERALGRLHIEIGVRPSYPAEFIIVRIGIWYGGSQVTEG